MIYASLGDIGLKESVILCLRVWLLGKDVVGADLTLGSGHDAYVQCVWELRVTSLLNTSIHSASKSRNELA